MVSAVDGLDTRVRSLTKVDLATALLTSIPATVTTMFMSPLSKHQGG